MAKNVTHEFIESHLVEGRMKMADEFGTQKAFLTWEESVEILLVDACHGIARAQRLLAIRYLRGRGVPKDEAVAFYCVGAGLNLSSFRRSERACFS